MRNEDQVEQLTRCRHPHAAWSNPRWCRQCGACDGRLRPTEAPAMLTPIPDKELDAKAQQGRDSDAKKRQRWNFVLR